MWVRELRIVTVGAGLAMLAGCGAATVSTQVSTPSGSGSASSLATSAPIQLSTVTVDPRLPPALPLPAGLLASTDSSWLVAIVAADDAETDDPAARVHYLVSPDGVRYELPDVGDVALLQWLPGTPDALVMRHRGEGAVEIQLLDLETARPVGGLDWPALHEALPTTTGLSVTLVGDSTTDLIVALTTPTGGRVLRAAADGTVQASVDADWASVAPAPGGGRLLAVERASSQVVEVDPDTLEVIDRPLDGECWPVWVDDTRWLASCREGNETAWFLVGPAGDSRLALDGQVNPLLALSDGSVLLTVADWADGALVGQRVVAVDDGAVTHVDVPLKFVSGATGPALVGSSTTPDLGDHSPVLGLTAPLLAWRPGDGTMTPLVPRGESGGAKVFPVGGPGASLGGWLIVGADGLEFMLAD